LAARKPSSQDQELMVALWAAFVVGSDQCAEGDKTCAPNDAFYRNTVATQLAHDHSQAWSTLVSSKGKPDRKLTKSERKKKLSEDKIAYASESQRLLESDPASWYWEHAVTTFRTFNTSFKGKTMSMTVRHNVVPEDVLPPVCWTCASATNTLVDTGGQAHGDKVPPAVKPKHMSDEGWLMATQGHPRKSTSSVFPIS
jgi:hypothetical protein